MKCNQVLFYHLADEKRKILSGIAYYNVDDELMFVICGHSGTLFSSCEVIIRTKYNNWADLSTAINGRHNQMYIWRVEVSDHNIIDIDQYLQTFSSYEKACKYLSDEVEKNNETIVSTDLREGIEGEKLFSYTVENDAGQVSKYYIHQELIDRT